LKSTGLDHNLLNIDARAVNALALPLNATYS